MLAAKDYCGGRQTVNKPNVRYCRFTKETSNVTGFVEKIVFLAKNYLKKIQKIQKIQKF